MSNKLEYISKEAKYQGSDLEMVIAFADDHDEFDRSFVDSLSDFYLNRGYLTDRQHEALRNIIEKWNIEERVL